MHSSNENLNPITFKMLQLQFVKWAAAWTKDETNVETEDIDLPDVVNILQAIGFRISYINAMDPAGCSPLRGGGQGVRIVVACNHSGQKCILEQPSDADECKCLKTPANDNKDSFWEVTATTPKTTHRQSLIETGSDLLPFVSKNKSVLIRNIMNYIVHVLNDNAPEIKNEYGLPGTPLTRHPGRKSEPFHLNPVQTPPMRASLGANENPPLPHVIVDLTDSPARYRSLDTLTAKDADIGLPQPGTLLPKNQIATKKGGEMICQSSPNIKIKLTRADYDHESSTSTIGEPSISGKAISLIKKASNDLLKAIALMEANKSPSVFEEKVSNASKSLKKLICTSKPTKKATTSKMHASSPNLRGRATLGIPKPRVGPIKSTGAIPNTSTTSAKASVVRKSTSSIASTTTGIPKPDGVVRKAINKYSNVKSTIPKQGAIKKKPVEIAAKTKL